MKGLEAVIAVVLILLITVALAASAYVFFSGTFGTITQSAQTSIGSTVQQMQGGFIIEAVKNTTNNVNFTIRNTGQTTLDANKISVYVNDVLVTGTISGASGTIEPGRVHSFGFQATGPYALTCPTNTLKVAFAGVATPQTATIKC